MGVSESEDKLPGLGTRPSSAGPVSILLGFLARLAVAAEYQILQFFWSGRENAVLQFLYIGLPLLIIVLAAQAQSLGREGIQRRDSNSIFGVIGSLISILALLACPLLFGLSCVASGGLIGF